MGADMDSDGPDRAGTPRTPPPRKEFVAQVKMARRHFVEIGETLLVADYEGKKVLAYSLEGGSDRSFSLLYEVTLPWRVVRVRKMNDEEFAVSPSASGESAVTFHRLQTGEKRGDFRHCFTNFVKGLECVLPIPGETRSGRVLFGDDGGAYHLWVADADTGALVTKLPGMSHFTDSIRCIPKWGYEVYAGAWDTGTRRWDLVKAVLLNKLVRDPEHQCVTGLDADPSGGILFSTSHQGTARLWSRDTQDPIATLPLEAQVGRSCLYAPDHHRQLFVGEDDGIVEVWDTRKTSERLLKLQPCEDRVVDLTQVSADEFACGDFAGNVSIWNRDGKVVKKLERRSGYVYGVCVMGTAFDRPNSTTTAVGGRDCGEDSNRAKFLIEIGRRRPLQRIEFASSSPMEIFPCLLVLC